MGLTKALSARPGPGRRGPYEIAARAHRGAALCVRFTQSGDGRWENKSRRGFPGKELFWGGGALCRQSDRALDTSSRCFTGLLRRRRVGPGFNYKTVGGRPADGLRGDDSRVKSVRCVTKALGRRGLRRDRRGAPRCCRLLLILALRRPQIQYVREGAGFDGDAL